MAPFHEFLAGMYLDRSTFTVVAAFGIRLEGAILSQPECIQESFILCRTPILVGSSVASSWYPW